MSNPAKAERGARLNEGRIHGGRLPDGLCGVARCAAGLEASVRDVMGEREDEGTAPTSSKAGVVLRLRWCCWNGSWVAPLAPRRPGVVSGSWSCGLGVWWSVSSWNL